MKKILDYLELLDFSKAEAKLYLSLLEKGPLTIAELAKLTDINRTAVYVYISSLTDKGVIAEAMIKTRRKIVATDPAHLSYLIEKKLETIKSVELKLPDILNTINHTFPKTSNEIHVDVTYYKGKKGLDLVYEEALSKTDLRVYANLTEMIKIFLSMDFAMFEDALKNNKKLRIFEIINDHPDAVKKYNLEETAQNGKYFYKFFPANFGLTSTTFIYDNKVAILNIKDEISVVVLHNSEYYNNSKKLFDFIWKSLPEPK
jgi:sugar-specific transcriptional regulator TrmB